jgi:hypothetical protein
VSESFSLWLPLILAAAAYAVLNATAGTLAGRGDEQRAEQLRNMAFLVSLLAAAWVVVLLLLVAVDMPNRIGDMLLVIGVIVGWFAILLLVFFGLSQGFGAIGRRFSRRSRSPSRDL